MQINKFKTYNDSILYNKGGYERYLLEFLIKSDEIDKTTEDFAQIIQDTKRRQVTSTLVSLLQNPRIVLLSAGTPLPSAFKVFAAKDIRDKSTIVKIFIDVSEIIKMQNGFLVCTNIDMLVAYLSSALIYYIYYADSNKFVINSSIIKDGISIFNNLLSYVMQFLKLNTYDGNRERLYYISSIYFQLCILQKEKSESVKNYAMQQARITTRDAEMIEMLISDSDFLNIESFIKCISRLFKLPELTLESFIDKWIYLFGKGTQFAVELFPAFATMLIYAYCGVYANNQKTIEKVVAKDMVQFISTIFRLGSELI